MTGMGGAAWAHAASIQIRDVALNADEDDRRIAAGYSTQARIMWSEGQLHLLVECSGPAFEATYTTRDDPLYKQDVIEVFLDVKGEMRSYAEILVSPKGTIFDSLHTWRSLPLFPADAIDWKAVSSDHVSDEHWNLDGLQAASSSRVNGASATWKVQLAIPIRSLLRQSGLPESLSAGQIMRMNLLRYGRPYRDDQLRLIQLNWAPTMRGCPHVSPMAMLPIRLISK